MEFTFTLKYRLSELDCNHDELVERLGAGGCEDALVGIGQPGRIALEFTRLRKRCMPLFRNKKVSQVGGRKTPRQRPTLEPLYSFALATREPVT